MPRLDDRAPSEPVAPERSPSPAARVVHPSRLAYLDNLKVVLVVGVIGGHSAITYGAEGSWYLAELDESTS